MNDNSFEDLVPTRNRRARQIHRREVWWQISLPLILFGLAFLAAGGVLIGSAAGGSPTGPLRDVSLVWVLLLGMIAALIPFALLAALTYAVIRLIAMLPGWTFKLQQLLSRISEAAAALSEAVSKPFIQINAITAGLRRFFNR